MVLKLLCKELFLNSCGIGKNKNYIQILYDMLCQNKSLVSLRLFGNEINNMEDFTKILGIFSEYNNGLKNSTMKSLDLSKNSCKIKITTNFWKNNLIKIMMIKDKLSHIIIIEDEKGQAFDERFLSKPDKSDKYKKGN